MVVHITGRAMQMSLVQICNGFIRAGEAPRERFMLWWRGVLSSNLERTKEYNRHPEKTCRCACKFVWG